MVCGKKIVLWGPALLIVMAMLLVTESAKAIKVRHPIFKGELETDAVDVATLRELLSRLWRHMEGKRELSVTDSFVYQSLSDEIVRRDQRLNPPTSLSLSASCDPQPNSLLAPSPKIISSAIKRHVWFAVQPSDSSSSSLDSWHEGDIVKEDGSNALEFAALCACYVQTTLIAGDEALARELEQLSGQIQQNPTSFSPTYFSEYLESLRKRIQAAHITHNARLSGSVLGSDAVKSKFEWLASNSRQVATDLGQQGANTDRLHQQYWREYITGWCAREAELARIANSRELSDGLARLASLLASKTGDELTQQDINAIDEQYRKCWVFRLIADCHAQARALKDGNLKRDLVWLATRAQSAVDNPNYQTLNELLKVWRDQLLPRVSKNVTKLATGEG